MLQKTTEGVVDRTEGTRWAVIDTGDEDFGTIDVPVSWMPEGEHDQKRVRITIEVLDS
jgi:hypothetical protein